MYNVAADPNSVSFVNTPSDANQLAYVSEVTYGRKGLMMIKTNKSMSDIKAEMEVSANYGLHKGEIGGFVKSINRDSSTEIRVFFYGGSSSVAARSLRENDMNRGFDKWVEAEAGNGLMALPISYKVKNLNGEQLKISSRFEIMDTDCVPKKNLKLKVTLVELQCDTSGDPEESADGDFGITQHVRYKANRGDWKTPTKITINKFSSHKDCFRGDIETAWEGETALICGNSSRQIHVYESRAPQTRNDNINNSVVFEITPEEANDKQAVFEIDTWVKEYSGRNNVVMNFDPRVKKVAIYDVLAILRKIKTIKHTEDDGAMKYKDGRVDQSVYFDYFDGVSLPLRAIGYSGSMILEGPIRARNKGDALNQKAFVWMRFELID